MWKLLFSAVAGGGPYEWAALGLGAVLILGGTFAAGAEWQASRDVKVAVSAAPAAATAQHDADVKQHAAATQANRVIIAHDAVADKKLNAILADLAKLKPQKDCSLGPDITGDLNKAGKVQQ